MILLNSQDKKEISYYPEITKFIEAQIKSNFKSKGIDISVYWEIGELKTKLKKILKEHPMECECATNYANKVPPLSLDIFGLVTNGKQFRIIILEIKKRNSVGLSEWSQLLGYTMVSDASYGLLINVDAGASQRLTDILTFEKDLSRIQRIKKEKNEISEHLLGFMEWNSLTNNFEYSNLGELHSISILTSQLYNDFYQNL